MRQMLGQGPQGRCMSSQNWTKQMRPDTSNKMPRTQPAPMAMSAKWEDQSDFGRMGRGKAGATERDKASI